MRDIAAVTLSIAVFLCFADLDLDSHAGFIRISADVRTSVSNKTVMIEISMENQGDEAAHNVQADALFMSEPVSTPATASIPPGSKISHSVELETDEKFARIIIPILMHYEDANAHPFSAITYADASTEKAVSRPFLIKCDKTSLEVKAHIPVTVKNLTGQSRELILKTALPKEISADSNNEKLRLGPNEEARLELDIRNFSALPGSSYNALVLGTTNIEGYRYDQKGLCRIEVVESGLAETILRHRVWIFTGLALLLAVYMAAQFYSLRPAKE